jgi:diguanylate cyclase (GGDEF)-like protein/PAS domain S-box-containing protein
LEKNFTEVLLNNVHDGIYFVDPDMKIFFWNQGAEEITGYKPSDVLGKKCSDHMLIHVDESGQKICEHGCPLKKALDDGQIHTLEAYLHHKEGYRLPVSIRTVPLFDKQGESLGAVETFYETSPKFVMPQRKQELERMQLLDSLTEIGNRTFLEMHIRSRIDEMKRYRLPFALLYVDIDHLKEINETYGKSMGDQILRTVAQTISNNIRFFDIAGRWAGDEFLVIVLNVNEKKLDFVANKLRLLVEQSTIMVESKLIRATVSMGATIAHRVDSTETLTSRAESLMNHSKWLGGNRVSFEREKDEGES